jgi:hypothetical protein
LIGSRRACKVVKNRYNCENFGLKHDATLSNWRVGSTTVRAFFFGGKAINVKGMIGMLRKTKKIQPFFLKNSLPADLPPGYIQFWDNYLPSLKEGDYTLKVTTELPAIPESKADLASTTQMIRITGPRFNLPAEDIYSQHPAPNSQGLFDTELPHIVLSKKVLPWEIALKGEDSTTPWLALIIVTPTDRVLDPNGVPMLLSGTVSECLTPDATEPNVVKPAIDKSTLSSDESQLICQRIRLTRTAFETVMPQMADVRYLTHCRQVSLRDHVFDNVLDPGWFSVVLGNRLPKPPAQGNPGLPYEAHLISLEGLEDYLRKGLPSTAVEVITLNHWAFTSLPEKAENFDILLKNLAAPDSTQLTLRLPLPPVSSEPVATVVQQKIANGYVPMLYHTVTGENTVGWYRGPFVPVNVPLNPTLPQHSQTGHGELIYDPTYGMFTVSYAVAWQLGRSLALADDTFVSSLMRFRWQQHRQVDLEVRRQTLQSHYAQLGLFKMAKGETLPTPIEAMGHALLNLPLVQHIQTLTRETPVQPVRTQQTPLLASPKKTTVSERAAAQRAQRKAHQHRLQAETSETTTTNELQLPTDIQHWLSDLCLLRKVPFGYFVPNPDALPIESLRFFQIDPNWINALLDGALSLGLHSTRDDALNGEISAAVKQVMSTQLPETGFLIRSDLIANWPNLAVKRGETDTTIQIVRQEQLAPNVLLCLFNGKPTELLIGKPDEQLQFGVSDGDIELRDLDPNKFGVPRPDIKPPVSLSNFFRQPSEQRVVNVAGTTPHLVGELNARLGRQDVGPAALALELVQAPDVIQFVLK